MTGPHSDYWTTAQSVHRPTKVPAWRPGASSFLFSQTVCVRRAGKLDFEEFKRLLLDTDVVAPIEGEHALKLLVYA